MEKHIICDIHNWVGSVSRSPMAGPLICVMFSGLPNGRRGYISFHNENVLSWIEFFMNKTWQDGFIHLHSAESVFRRQNLMSVDIKFWRLHWNNKTIYNGLEPIT